MKQKPTLLEAQRDLIHFTVKRVPDDATRAQLSKLIARYVAAGVRDDRERRQEQPLGGRSMFDIVFGRVR